MEAVSNKISRKDMEREARRRAILNTAIQLFSEYGFYEVKVDQIADQVGLSKGTIYLYFENKEALFFSIITEKADELVNSLKSSVKEADSFIVSLKQFVTSYLKFFKENDAFFKIMHSTKSRISAETHYKFHDYAKDVYQIFYDLICRMIKQGQKENILRPDRTEAMCKVLRGILNSYTFHRIFDPGSSSVPVEEEAEEVVELFIKGAQV